MKRALPLVVLAVIAVVVVLVVMLTRAPATSELPRPVAPNVIRPSLHVFDSAGVEQPPGSLVMPAGATFDLRITLEANAFVYVFDETESTLNVVWKHAEPTPWEKGEYGADAPAFEGLGEHKLVVIASPTAIGSIDTWKVISSDALRGACPQCEQGSYSFSVSGPLDAGQ